MGCGGGCGDGFGNVCECQLGDDDEMMLWMWMSIIVAE
jgi:hypothetical protein